MTREGVVEVFDRLSKDEYLKFERIENPPYSMMDVCAFIYLDNLCSFMRIRKAVASAMHEEIYLAWAPEDLAEAGCTEDDILYLVRCGVSVSGDTLYLVMIR